MPPKIPRTASPISSNLNSTPDRISPRRSPPIIQGDLRNSPTDESVEVIPHLDDDQDGYSNDNSQIVAQTSIGNIDQSMRSSSLSASLPDDLTASQSTALHETQQTLPSLDNLFDPIPIPNTYNPSYNYISSPYTIDSSDDESDPPPLPVLITLDQIKEQIAQANITQQQLSMTQLANETKFKEKARFEEQLRLQTEQEQARLQQVRDDLAATIRKELAAQFELKYCEQQQQIANIQH